MKSKNKILIIGQGNIGTFLGATLSVKNSVVHYVQNKEKARKTIVLNFTDKRNKSFRLARGKTYTYRLTDSLAEINSFDNIIIPVSHTQFRNVIGLLRFKLNPNQTLILMGNVWNDFDWFEQNIKNPYIFVFPNFGGAIVSNKLQGWLIPNFTTGITDRNSQKFLEIFNSILNDVGFKTKIETDIKGWLMTHFAYNAGMLLEAANQDGFKIMSKNWKSLNTMYKLIKECMQVADGLRIQTQNFSEGKSARKPLWWNVIKTYTMFLIPGLSKSADASKNLVEWKSYGHKIYLDSKKLNINCPLLQLNFANNGNE